MADEIKVNIIRSWVSRENGYSEEELAVLSGLAAECDPVCSYAGPDGFFCTCVRGHEHGHVAHDPHNRVLATWPKE